MSEVGAFHSNQMGMGQVKIGTRRTDQKPAVPWASLARIEVVSLFLYNVPQSTKQLDLLGEALGW